MKWWEILLLIGGVGVVAVGGLFMIRSMPAAAPQPGYQPPPQPQPGYQPPPQQQPPWWQSLGSSIPGGAQQGSGWESALINQAGGLLKTGLEGLFA